MAIITGTEVTEGLPGGTGIKATAVELGTLQAVLRESCRETWITIQRPATNERVTLSVARGELIGGLLGETRFGIFVCVNGRDKDREIATLFLPELLLLREFLNYPQVQKILDLEAAAQARKAEKVAVAS